MANTLKVKFNVQPASNDSIFFTASSGTVTKSFGNGVSQVAIGGDIYATATNYKDAINATAGWSATLDNDTVFINSTAAPIAYNVTSASTLPAGTNFASLSSQVLPTVAGNGETVNIKVDTLDRALKFLSTEFMDLGGKNNQVAYRNPKYLNFASPSSSAPTIGPNARVVICKNASNSNGDYIGSYLDGNEGGTTPNGVKPGWEWWSRSFIIYDTPAGDAQNIIDNVILNGSQINQSTSTCAWVPGSNALSNSAPSPIDGSCAAIIETPFGAASQYSYKAVFTGTNFHTGDAMTPTFKVLSNVIAISGSAYSSTITIDAPTGFGFNNPAYYVQFESAAIDETTPYSNISIVSIVPSGTMYDANVPGTSGYNYSSNLDITFTDSNFGGSGSEKELYFTGSVSYLNNPSLIDNAMDQQFNGKLKIFVRSLLSTPYPTTPFLYIWFGVSSNSEGAINAPTLDFSQTYYYEDDIVRSGFFKFILEGLVDVGGYFFIDIYTKSSSILTPFEVLSDFKGSVDLNLQGGVHVGTSKAITLKGIHAYLRWDEFCPDPEEFILVTETVSKKAKDLVKGEKVYTQHEHTKEWGLFEIELIETAEAHKNRVEFTDGTNVTVSVSHKFLTENDEWKKCLSLLPGDILQGQLENKIVSSVHRLERGPVVKIEIKDAHTYVVAGLISHNKTNPNGSPWIQNQN